MRAEGVAQLASVTERIEQALEREAPVWGIRPVPPEHRRLSGVDFFVLWGDLSIGLLVLLTGALLVPALGLPKALLAIVVGSVIGCIPLALVGLAGAREGLPGMVLFRKVLGVRGSYLPSVLNIAQLIGWTGFEFWAMSLVANQMSIRLFDFSAKWLWLGIGAIWHAHGQGGFPGHFWLAVDLVIAMPVSWLPLVADYNRFARNRHGSAA